MKTISTYVAKFTVPAYAASTFDTCDELTAAIAFGGTFAGVEFHANLPHPDSCMSFKTWSEVIEHRDGDKGDWYRDAPAGLGVDCVVLGFVLLNAGDIKFFTYKSHADEACAAGIAAAGGVAPADMMIGRVVLSRTLFEAGQRRAAYQVPDDAAAIDYLLGLNAPYCGYGKPTLAIEEKMARAYRIKLIAQLEQLKQAA